MHIRRLLRGIVKTALTWAVVWVPVSLIPLGLATLFGASLPLRALVPLVISQAVMGAINGGVFASVVAIAGRRKTFETLSLPWIAACGAGSAALFPFVVRAILFATIDIALPARVLLWALATNAVLGAGCAAMTLSIARRAPVLPPDKSEAWPAVEAGSA